MTAQTSTVRTPTTAREAAAASATRPHSLVRAGGVASHVVAGTYVLGFGAMAAYLAPAGFVDAVTDPEASLTFLLTHQSAMSLWYLVLYLVGGAAMALVALGVADRVRTLSPRLARVSAAFGLLWSGLLLASGCIALVGQHAVATMQPDHADLALTTWTSVSVIQDALGGGIEVVGALWVAVVGAAIVRSRTLSAALGGLALGLAAVGVATLIPAAADAATSLFGLGLLVWFTWVGVSLSRRP